ncbi:MAG TPA: hypothetical protein VG711_04195, partial [Phycisphaerales bacterium]|nr:hypothetical protein [Phycisphaerales bacterium]
KLLRRRAGARTFSLMWSAITMFQIIGSTAWALYDSTQTPSSNPIAQALGIAFGFLLGSALPITLLVWLNRPKIKSEAAVWK